jgi:hypothetical protein
MQQTLSNSSKFLSSPISFLLIFLWIANDHIWKAQFHNEITGKISDITGLIVFPFFLTAIGFIINYGTLKEKTLFVFTNLTIATLFSVINWSQEWNNWIYINCFGNQNGTADKTDLLCVPICLLANLYFYKKYSTKEITVSAKIKYLHIIAINLSALAFINTSTPEPKSNYEEEIFYPILLARPESRDFFKIGEEISFIWYTEGKFKEFQIYFYTQENKNLEKKISIKTTQLQKHLDTRINKYFYIYSSKITLQNGYYRLAIIGIVDNEWEKNNSELYSLIEEHRCNILKLSCTEFRWLGFEE